MANETPRIEINADLGNDGLTVALYSPNGITNYDCEAIGQAVAQIVASLPGVISINSISLVDESRTDLS